ncbi:hypothetical protein RB195_023157 [Necator americanus]|uniref:Uncharacterized protein n=1 Tax=Necator americanus TaxID=51031 RepID=A0ABR1EI14_NECAM
MAWRQVWAVERMIRRVKREFKQKTLPSAKYFDDHCLLHLIPGEKDDQTIFERMKELVRKAMCTGVPVFVSNPSKDHDQREKTSVEMLNTGSKITSMQEIIAKIFD